MDTAVRIAATVLACTMSSFSWFHSATVIIKKEPPYCSVLLSGLRNPRELFVSCRAMMFVVMQSLKAVGGIFLLVLSIGVKKLLGRRGLDLSLGVVHWRQEVTWGQGRDETVYDFVECG